MTLPYRLHHAANGDCRPALQVALPTTGLLASIVAECNRSRRDKGHSATTTTLDVSQDHEQAILADAVVVRRALEPLIRRALESATQPDATRELPAAAEVVVTTVDVGDAIEIEVADSGPALSEHVMKWLNENAGRSYHDNVVPEGAGLALAAVRSVVARIDGAIRATNCPEGGAAITLRLPRRQAGRLAA